MSKQNDVEEFWNSLPEEERSKMLNSFKGALADLIDTEVKKLQEIEEDIIRLESEYKELWQKESKMTYSPEMSEVRKKRQMTQGLIKTRKILLLRQKNAVEAITNKGTTVQLEDHEGNVFEKVSDFRKVDSEYISFDEDNILTNPKPVYIPYINEETYKAKSYNFDTVRLSRDTYLLCASSFYKDAANNNIFVLVTLDQLVLTTEYYFVKAKALAKQRADQQNQAARDRFLNMEEDVRRKYMFQTNIYHSLPAKEKKKITKEEWDSLNLEERQKIYLPVKKYGVKRVKREVELTTMPRSFHVMYEYWVDPTVYLRDKEGNRTDKGRFGDPKVFAYWRAYVEMMEFKIKDLAAQRKDLDEIRKKGIETSFGNSNTETPLKDQFGILIKRQNGDKVKPVEQEQIKEAWVSVQKVFGNLKPNSEKYNMKVSHAGKKFMFSMGRALGVYVPSLGTIGVTDKFGDKVFKSVMSHEVAHFIDNFIGKLNGKRWATDDFEGTAGIIAFTFRNNMNKPKQYQSDYINSTKECFARALQEYYMWKIYGDDATVMYSTVILSHDQPIYNIDSMVKRDVFEKKIVPLIDKFLNEELDVFDTTFDLDGTNQPIPLSASEDTSNELSDAISGLEIMLRSIDESEASEIKEAIAGLKLLQNMGNK